MSEEATEHPAATVADKVAGKVVDHLLRGARGRLDAEHEVRAARFAEQVQGMHEDVRQAIGPMVSGILADIPEGHELRPIFEALQSPSNPIALALMDILGVVGFATAAIGTFGAIEIQQFKNAFYSVHRNVPLSPNDLANMVVQGYLGQSGYPNPGSGLPDAETQAGWSGIGPNEFDLMVEVTGQPPSPQDLFELYRRGEIHMSGGSRDTTKGADLTDLSVIGGLKQGHTKDSWVEKFSKLAYVRPSPTDFVAAAVRDQVDYVTAARWANSLGLDLATRLADPPPLQEGVSIDVPEGAATDVPAPSDFFRMLYDVAGRPPGPVEMAVMAHRGVIQWDGLGEGSTTFQQGIAESDVKTKWTKALRDISTRLPADAEVGMALRDGWISSDDAHKRWEANALDPSWWPVLEHMLLVQKTEEEHRLAKGEILTLYQAGRINEEQVKAFLAPLGYTGETADWLISFADFQRVTRLVDRMLEEIERAYVGGTIPLDTAVEALKQLDIPAATVSRLTADWQVSKKLQVPKATAAEIGRAVYYGVETAEDAMQDLMALGYSEYQAYRILSVEAEGPIFPKDHRPARPPGAQI